jgi:glycosyltransferase involved in cell wall biosynthesis
MSEKSDILIVGQTPPPFHGQAVVTEMLFDHTWDGLKVERLRMAYSESIETVGRANLGKVWHLFSLILQTWGIAFVKRPNVLYYLPASANRTPVIRDIIYLSCVRWCFSKTVFHYHAGGLPQFLETIGMTGKMARRVYSNADLSIDVIETSPPTGSYFASKKNIVVRNGSPVNRTLRKRSDAAVYQALFVGVLNEGKGLKDIVETAKILSDRGIHMEFKIVGAWSSNEFETEIIDLLTGYKLTDSFVFTGSLSGDEKWQAYADADVFFFPSHYEAETFGMVLVEAMAFGLPSVTTNWRGIPLVVEGGNCSILCDVRAPHQYADAIEELHTNDVKRASMRHAAGEHYDSNYTKEHFVTSMEAAFRGILNTDGLGAEQHN